ncbi:MAG TPA: glycosyltransferase [Stellaceae bacterium]|nr:glycosyltransferase [Stellaceae bacterium]
MNIAFVSGNPHMPQVLGGVEVNTHALAGELTKRGKVVCVLAKLSLRNRFGLWRAARITASGHPIWVDHDLGYPVFRSRRPANHAAALPRPNVAVVQNGPMLDLAAGFARIAVPAVAYLHGLGFESWPIEPAGLPFRGYIANSCFTAERFRRRFGLDPLVLPPLFRRVDYETPVSGAAVTFINPVQVKGVDLALRIAALCPNIPFAFVRGWPLGIRESAGLRRELRRLGNVELRDRTGDMRTVYRDTKVLLVPSQWEDETWGRVVTEAQFSGIPVIASDRGGLPESVGPGGIILAHDARPEVWAEAVTRLWSDMNHHERLSRAALDHSARPDLDTDHQVSMLLETLCRVTAPSVG